MNRQENKMLNKLKNKHYKTLSNNKVKILNLLSKNKWSPYDSSRLKLTINLKDLGYNISHLNKHKKYNILNDLGLVKNKIHSCYKHYGFEVIDIKRTFKTKECFLILEYHQRNINRSVKYKSA